MTAGTEPALSATEWLSGINRGKQQQLQTHTGLVDAPLVDYGTILYQKPLFAKYKPVVDTEHILHLTM